jgi:hypothetical protein
LDERPYVREANDSKPSDLAYLQQRNLAVEKGLEALPKPPSFPFVAHPLTVESLSEVPLGTLHYPSSLLHDDSRQPRGPL